MRKYALALLFLVAGLNAFAVVTGNNTIAASNPTGYGYTLDWSYVYRVNAAGGGGTGIPVDPYWLLTAAHVADDASPAKVAIGNATYNATSVVYHGTADLALLQFSSPIFAGGYYPIYTGAFPTHPPSSKLTGLLVGYGYAGNLTAGDVQSTYYKWSIAPNTKRWGTNKIDGTADGYSAGGFTSSVLYMDFDLGDTTYEAGGAIYDSGGPVFVQDSGVWKAAGIMINVAATRSGTPSGYYDRTIAVRLPAYNDWIQSVIPEPSTLAMGVGAVAIGVFVRRFRRR